MDSYPKGKFFEEFEEGEEFQTVGRTITESDVLNFSGVSGDFNPLHLDEEFAKNSPFKTRVPHGLCIMSIATGLIDRLGVISCTALACLDISWKFFKPVLIGDSIGVVMKVLEKREGKKGDRGLITFEMAVRNQRKETVETGMWTLMMARENYFRNT